MKLAALWQAALLGCLSFPSIVASRASQFVNEIPEIASSGNQEATHQLYTSSRHPKHKWHIKAHPAGAWCDPTTRSWTGYIDSGYGKELFFWYFESRSAPKDDPVVMWINGGPGGTSAMGLLMEQGPCRIKPDPQGLNDTYPNPYAWNENANVFFLDQPIGVGFSHAKHGQTVSTTEEAAVDVAAFIEIFFEVFNDLKGRPFHMAGESYAGRYLPLFASAVYDNNAKLTKDHLEPINLQSVLIGNGLTSTFTTIDTMYDLLCTKHIDLGKALLGVKECVNLVQQLKKCHGELQKHCLDTSDYVSCGIWLDYCIPLWDDTPLDLGLNRFNLNQSCTFEENEKYECMKEMLDMQQYLGLPEVQRFLGADVQFDTISNTVNAAFEQALDMSHQTYYYVANMLERGIRVLNYVGTLDAACSHFSQERWMAEMPWTGRDGYNAAEWKSWKVNKKEAGIVKSYKNLTLLKVFGAGHLVPTDQPESALALLNEWIHPK